MTGTLILPRIWSVGNPFRRPQPARRADLHALWLHPERLPRFVRDAPIARRTLDLLGPLDWSHVPDRDLERNWGQPTVSYAWFAAICLVKLNEGLVSMGHLRQYLVEQPSLVWLCGFPLHDSPHVPGGFEPEASLPTQRHLTRLLRRMPSDVLQFLLADSARLVLAELRQVGVHAGDCISLDTKHIIAWVKENNPKAYVDQRYDKNKQPPGDPDCRLGCNRRAIPIAAWAANVAITSELNNRWAKTHRPRPPACPARPVR